jgi:hypothetical protein
MCAAAVVNWPKALLQCRRMIAEGASLDQAQERLAVPPRT